MRNNFEGRVAVCCHGILGVVEKKRGEIYYGTKVLDGSPWQSKSPRFLSIADTVLVIDELVLNA